VNKLYARIWVAPALLLLFSALIWLTDADLRLARFVYDERIGWPGVHRFPWDFIYDYAQLPAFILFGLSLLVLLAGTVVKSLKVYRRQTLFLVLLLIIGPGLLINVLLKDNHGRARPREVIEFGGNYEFGQIWERGETGKNSSFPSGHSSVGFYMIAPWFLLRRQKQSQGLAWLVGGIGFGSLIGTARILQGGHFLSDVLWSGGLVYITGELLILLLDPDDSTPETS
jgi:membrane-associated PAP2 superfamily phosphatase